MLIKQKTNRIALPNTEIQTVKGTTKIELYNPNTRIKKVFRDENTFQSAVIAKYLRSLGYTKVGLSDYSWQNIVGGLLLFRDTITVGSEYMPAGNKMIGNGAYNVINNGTPTEMGSYNSVESSASTSAITQVYDFSTSQANGDINCVCLTSATGGYVGYGNSSGESHSTQKSLTNTQNSTFSIDGFVHYNNYVYKFEYTEPTLTITKTRYAITQGSVFDTMAQVSTIDLSQLSGYVTGFNINYARTSQSDGKVYLFSDKALNSGGTDTYLVFDLSTETAEFKTFTNSAATALPKSYVSVSHGKVIFSPDSNSNSYYMFDLASSILLDNTGLGVARIADITSDLSLISKYNNPADYIYDSNNNTLYPSNANYTYLQYEPTADILISQNTRYGSLDSSNVWNNPLYLATINNLDNTVQKTAAQTMKVIYTLTEV